MALSKTIVDDKGQITQYHKISAVGIIYIDGQERIDLNIASYANEDYRLTEKEVGLNKVLNNIGVSLSLTNEDFSRANLYARIKNEVETFLDAVDC